MNSNQIDILLATYNGERYLSDQLDSILKQSCDNWRILIRDDASDDGTSTLIERYKKKYSSKIFHLEDDKQNIGVCGNFSELLRNSKSDYIMFCDQDDVWNKDKIKITFKKMEQIENIYGSQSPILIHTDLMVVGDNLEKIANSFWKFAHLNPKGTKKISRLLVQNFVTGCTMMINRALKNLSPIIPDEALSHDWWLALVAFAFGKIESIPIPTVLYRQHQKNVFGVNKWNHFTFLINAIRTLIHQNILAVIKEEKNQTKRLCNQAKSFYNHYSENLDSQQSLLLLNFSNLETYNFIDRRIKLLKYGFIRPGFARSLKLFFYV
jgi:glycosyltransferase involved in cell wall biosynthesis